jgi:hypothetical protein
LFQSASVNCLLTPVIGRTWNLVALFRKDFVSCAAPGALVFDRFIWRTTDATSQPVEIAYAAGDLVRRAACFGNSLAYANLYATAGTLEIL